LTSNIDIKELSKLYYTIGEVASMFDVNRSLIRFWEKEFTIIQPKKNKKGNRLFTPKDIENFNKIYNLVKIQGFTLEGAKKELKKKSLPTETTLETIPIEQILSKLEKIKENLLKLKHNLNHQNN
jgi:DNA-binding transcriptional MerR regulator